ncbi:MAG: DUF2336 domain-containing protein [Sphingomonadales bacterium]
MFEKVLRLVRGRVRNTSELTYEDARAILEAQNSHDKLELADRDDVAPEILYYLATDTSTDVRRKVARNSATPHHAHRILASDDDDEVRCELARKIGRLLPDLDAQAQSDLLDRTIDVIEMLARDQVDNVRQIIADEIRHTTNAPHAVIRRLAEDTVLDVCAPVLQYSPLLSEQDLREIISYTKVKGALAAIAQRTDMTEPLADAIAASLDVPAVAALLANKSAQIREEALDAIIDNAADVETWHEPLARRPNLSLRVMRRIASFVASSLIDVMVEQNDLGAGDGAALLGRVRDRIEDERIAVTDSEGVAEVVADLHRRDALNDAFIVEAIEKGQREVVTHALAELSGIDIRHVQDIMRLKNTRRITALTWRAGLSMRTAFRVQKDVARVAPKNLLNARNGFDYPISTGQMESLLEVYED